MEADRLRAGVIEGFQDAAEGQVHPFKGSVRDAPALFCRSKSKSPRFQDDYDAFRNAA